MTYYEHEGKKYTLDQLCEEGIIIAIRGYMIDEELRWYADTSSPDGPGWPISDDEAVYLAARYDMPIQTVV